MTCLWRANTTAPNRVADVALLHDMAAGRLDEQRVREAAQVLLEHLQARAAQRVQSRWRPAC